MHQGLQDIAFDYYKNISIFFEFIYIIVLISTMITNYIFIYSMSESIENTWIGKKMIETEEGEKSRIGVFLIRAVLIFLVFLLSLLSNDMITYMDFCGVQFASSLNFIIPVSNYFCGSVNCFIGSDMFNLQIGDSSKW